MKWTIYHTGLFKKIVMHVKELSRMVTLEYCRTALVIKAFAAFNQSYADIYIPCEFLARAENVADDEGVLLRQGRVTIDITHLYRALKSCACTDTIELVMVDAPRTTLLRTTFVRQQRRQTFMIQCQKSERQCSLLPLDHDTRFTVSCDSFHATMLQLADIVHVVKLELSEATSPKEELHIRGASDEVEVHCRLPARILCGGATEHRDACHLGRFDMHTLLEVVHFCTLSLNGEVQLNSSPDLPLKLLFSLPGNGRVTLMLGSSRHR